MEYKDLTPEQKEKRKDYLRKWRQENSEEFKAQKRRQYLVLRSKIFDHYGWSCRCCGESESEFLTIDHINGGGNQHKISGKMGRGGGRFYSWLIRNDFPKEFQTLCMNCNFARSKLHNGGICPHKKRLQSIPKVS